MNTIAKLCRVWNEDEGQDLVEYGLIASLISVGTITALISFGTSVTTFWKNFVSKLP